MMSAGRGRLRLPAFLAVALLAFLVGGTGADATAGAAGDWSTWQKDQRGSRFNEAETKTTPGTVGKLKLKWAFGYKTPGTFPRSQPAVVGDSSYFGGPDGEFYALDAKTGAGKWTFALNTVDPAAGPGTVRDGATVVNGKVYFGDQRGYLYALDQQTGKLAWATRVDSQPSALLTSSPLFFEGRIYVGTSSGDNIGDQNKARCTFRGHIDSIDARTGALVWRYYTVPPPQAAGTWPSGATNTSRPVRGCGARR